METYFYDNKNKRYKRVEPNRLQKFVHTTCKWLIIGAVICGIVTGILYRTAANPTLIALQVENNVLRNHLQSTQTAINKFQMKLDSLAQDDNKLFRTILGMKPISEGEREAGSGGAEVYAKFNVYGQKTASVLKETARAINRMRREIKIQKRSFRKIKKQYKFHRKKLSHIPAIKPVDGYISSGFGMRYHPILHVRRMHTGVDIAALVGTKVYATADGIVKFVGRDGGYGNLIIIDNGYGYETYFAHLSAYAKGIEPGVKVSRGELIGFVGQTGLTTGPHLHYEVRIDGDPVNPIYYFYNNTTPMQYIKLKRRAQASTKTMDF